MLSGRTSFCQSSPLGPRDRTPSVAFEDTFSTPSRRASSGFSEVAGTTSIGRDTSPSRRPSAATPVIRPVHIGAEGSRAHIEEDSNAQALKVLSMRPGSAFQGPGGSRRPASRRASTSSLGANPDRWNNTSNTANNTSKTETSRSRHGLDQIHATASHARLDASVRANSVMTAAGDSVRHSPPTPAPDTYGPPRPIAETAMPATVLMAAAMREDFKPFEEISCGAVCQEAMEAQNSSLRAARTLAQITGGDGGGGGGAGLHRQRQQNGFFIRKHMQSVAQTIASQKEMIAFETTLKQIEEDATTVRRKWRAMRAQTFTVPTDVTAGDNNNNNNSASAAGAESVGAGDAFNEQAPGPADSSSDSEESDLWDDDPEDVKAALSGGTMSKANLQRAQERSVQSWAALQKLRVENPEVALTMRKEVARSQLRLTTTKALRSSKLAPSQSRSLVPALPSIPSVLSTSVSNKHVDGVDPLGNTANLTVCIEAPGEEQSGAGTSCCSIDWAGTGGASPTDTKTIVTVVKEGESSNSSTDRLQITAQSENSGGAVNNRTVNKLEMTLASSSSEQGGEEGGDVASKFQASMGHSSSSRAVFLLPSDGPITEVPPNLSPSKRRRAESIAMNEWEKQLVVLLERGNGRSVYGIDYSNREAQPKSRKSASASRANSTHSNTSSSAAADGDAARRCSSPMGLSTGDRGEKVGSLSGTLPPLTAVPQSPTPGEGDPLEDADATNKKEADADRQGKSAPRTSTTTKGVNRRVTFKPSRSATPQTTVGGATSTTSAAPTQGKPAHKRRRPRATKKGRAPLPAVAGVGPRSAILFQQEMLETRQQELNMEHGKSKDIERTCELLRQLQPMREDLLRRDALDLYKINDPSEWEELYPKGSFQSSRRAKGSRATSMRTTPSPSPSLQGDSARKAPPSAPLFSNPETVLEKHRKQIFETALAIDEEQRRAARLEYVDVLESMSKIRVPDTIWPAAQSALAHGRKILTETPEAQDFEGFQSIVHGNFELVQLVQWPVQQMLQHLAALFRVSTTQYREWMASLYQQLSNSYDYEARFRAVDRTIKGRELPSEAHVRLVLHCCRRLPRVVDDGSAVVASSGHHQRSPAHDPSSSNPAESSAEGSPLGGGAPMGGMGMAEASSSGLGAADLSATKAHPPLSTTMAPGSPLLPTGSPKDTNAETHTGGGMGFGEPQYSLRIQAERQIITSSAVPAGNGSRASGRSTLSVLEVEDTGAAAAGAAKRQVYFYDQTFKLHLYDASSAINMVLLRDGQPVAEGTFSVQRYGNGRTTQLWLPLKGKHCKKTELKMTVELIS